VTDVRVNTVDTDYSPYEWQTVASRLTWSMGNAVLQAAETARLQVLTAVAQAWSEDIQDLDIVTEKNIGYFTANGEPLPVSGGRDYLITAAEKAIDFLDGRSPNGFFIMIEGSQIDWGGHANDANYVVSEMHEFEKIVAAALDFAARDKHTLVVVTGDHETGGFAVQPGSKLNDIQVAFTTKSHTAIMIPVFAQGPGAEAFRGIYENTAIFDKMKAALDLN
jgi:alkaline phosphatase